MSARNLARAASRATSVAARAARTSAAVPNARVSSRGLATAVVKRSVVAARPTVMQVSPRCLATHECMELKQGVVGGWDHLEMGRLRAAGERRRFFFTVRLLCERGGERGRGGGERGARARIPGLLRWLLV